MFLTVTGPMNTKRECVVPTRGAKLVALLGPYADGVEGCFVNGAPLSNWRDYTPCKSDRVNLIFKTELLAIPAVAAAVAAAASATGISAAVIAGVLNAVVGLVLSLSVSMIMRALTPKPRQPKLDGSGQSYGISGFSNTTGQGVPIPVWYGLRRVWPHVIASGADISDDGRSMTARILYSIGDSGGDGYESLSDVLIDKIPAEQYEGVRIDTRLGYMDQTVIPGFEDTVDLWFDGRSIPEPDLVTSIIYQTKAANVNKSILILSFPGGLWRVNSSGKRRDDGCSLLVQQRKVGDTNWQTVMPGPGEWSVFNDRFWIHDNTQAGIFRKVTVDHSSACVAAANQYWADYPDVAADPNYNTSSWAAYQHYLDHGQSEGRTWHSELCAGAQWQIQLTFLGRGGPTDEPHWSAIQLLNVEEHIFSANAYPGYVLLGVSGLPAKQVRSLQSVEISVLVKGKRVKLPDGLGGEPLGWTRQRCWITRDIMTHPTCGMGYAFDESEIDDVQWGVEQAQYYDSSHDTGEIFDEDILGQDGNPEVRDFCDVGLTDRRFDWDWVKRIVGEGRGRVIPSGLKWKYLIDKQGDANLLYAEPGNIVEGSVQMEIAPNDDHFNQVISEFPDSADNYNAGMTQPITGFPGGVIPGGETVVQKVLSYETITRESHALRENMIVAKRQLLEKRRWIFTSPMSALVSEPMDLDWMSERVLGDIGAYAGVIASGSTATTIVLPITVELDPIKTYILIVQHKDNSMAETRTVTTPAGSWGAVDVSSPFNVIPVEGDVFALGEVNLDHIVTRAQDNEIDDMGHVKQIRTEYIEEVYKPEPLPDGLNLKSFPIVTVPPIPIRDAFVKSQLVQKGDGHWATVILFDVMPGVISIAATNTGVAWPKVFIPVSVLPQQIQGVIAGPFDSFQRYYFRGAYWRLTSGSGAGLTSKRKIIDFDPNPVSVLGIPSYNITLEGSQPLGAITGENCIIEWEKFADIDGFKVESSTDGQLEWTEIFKVVGVHAEIDGGDQGGTTQYFRFTPFNNSGIENRVARLVKGPITIIGDQVAPPPPIAVLAFATTSIITVEATFQLPMALDFAGIEIFVDQYRYVPPFNTKVLEGPVVHTRTDATRENGTSGTVAVRKTVDIRNVFSYPPAPSIWEANVRAYDYSGNKSAFVLSNDFYPQRLSTGDIA